MIPRRVFIVTFLVLVVGILAAFQYANYVDRRSNQKWCDLVGLFNDAYVANPPNTETGKKIAIKMREIEQEFKCT